MAAFVVGETCIMSAESGLYECKILECPHVYKPKGCEYVEINPHGNNTVQRFYMYNLKKFEEFPEDAETKISHWTKSYILR